MHAYRCRTNKQSTKVEQLCFKQGDDCYPLISITAYALLHWLLYHWTCLLCAAPCLEELQAVRSVELEKNIMPCSLYRQTKSCYISDEMWDWCPKLQLMLLVPQVYHHLSFSSSILHLTAWSLQCLNTLDGSGDCQVPHIFFTCHLLRTTPWWLPASTAHLCIFNVDGRSSSGLCSLPTLEMPPLSLMNPAHLRHLFQVDFVVVGIVMPRIVTVLIVTNQCCVCWDDWLCLSSWQHHMQDTTSSVCIRIIYSC